AAVSGVGGSSARRGFRRGSGSRSCRRRTSADAGGLTDLAGLEDAAPLTLAGAAPHAVVDAVVERVVQAPDPHGAVRADALGDLDPDAVGGEEQARGLIGAVAVSHPLGVQFLIHTESLTPGGPDLFLSCPRR